MVYCRLCLLNILFEKKIFQEYHQSNSLDPDQTRRFVGPDLGPNCLQRLAADVKELKRQTKSSRLFLNTVFDIISAPCA